MLSTTFTKKCFSPEELRDLANLLRTKEVQRFIEYLLVMLEQRLDDLETKEVDVDDVNWAQKRLLKDGMRLECKRMREFLKR